MTLMILVVIATVISVVLCHLIAKQKGLSPGFWAIMAVIFGPLAIPVLLLIKQREKKKKSDFVV